MAMHEVATPGTEAPGAPILLRVEDVALFTSSVTEVHTNGALVRTDNGGNPHVGTLDPQQLASIKSALDHVDWGRGDAICAR